LSQSSGLKGEGASAELDGIGFRHALLLATHGGHRIAMRVAKHQDLRNRKILVGRPLTTESDGERLAAQSEGRNQRAVAIEILPSEVGQVTAPSADHHEKSTP